MSRNRVFCMSMIAALLLCPTADVSAAGDPSKGEALFVGSTAFTNGGAPCLACHSLTGIGLSDGANYGPDLSSLYEEYGADGVEGVLESLEFPSMEAIYAGKPLTAEEMADLVVFFEHTAELSTTPGNGKLALLVIVGVIILLGLTLLAGKRRMKAARQPLIDRQRNLIKKGGLQ